MIDKISCCLSVAKTVFGFPATLTAGSFEKIAHKGLVATCSDRELTIYCDPVEHEDNLSVKFKYRGPKIPESLLESGASFFSALYEDEGVVVNSYRDNRDRFVFRLIVPKSAWS